MLVVALRVGKGERTREAQEETGKETLRTVESSQQEVRLQEELIGGMSSLTAASKTLHRTGMNLPMSRAAKMDETAKQQEVADQ